MTRSHLRSLLRTPVPLVGVVVCTGLLAEVWLGYRATAEWQTSSGALVAQRAKASLDTLMTALTRDMYGVQSTILSSRDWSARSFSRPYDARVLVAGAFARYPYPESFFGWNAESDGRPVIFIRASHPPRWLSSPIPVERYPVEIVDDARLGARLLEGIEADLRAARRYAVFDLEIEGEPYQIVSRLSYADGSPGRFESGFGFMVNLKRARAEYFAGILRQVAELTDADRGLNYSLVDDSGAYVVGGAGDALVRRDLPVLFVDPRQVVLPPSAARRSRVWSVQVSAASDDTLYAAAQGARRIRVVFASATAAMVVGLFVALRLTRASIDLANMRSDFVSLVTHELKTPLATILTAADTLLRGRITTTDGLKRYARLLTQESRRLMRLVDNLLAYARVTDVTEVYTFQPFEPAELVDAALRGFAHLRDATVAVDVPRTLPTIRADRTSIVLALDNVIDNAMRYSEATPWLSIRGSTRGAVLEIAVEDHGIGIPATELPLITKRFVRGRSTEVPGSGLGLAIVSRVIADHGGQMRIDSEVGRGTTVRLEFPLAGA
jgi:signal transduction histidine kinase